jgi:hypothetical protein
MSFNEAAAVLAVVLLVSVPWVTALVFAMRDVSRRPSGLTYLLLVLILVGSMPVAFVYLAYRAWRGPEPRVQQLTG